MKLCSINFSITTMNPYTKFNEWVCHKRLSVEGTTELAQNFRDGRPGEQLCFPKPKLRAGAGQLIL